MIVYWCKNEKESQKIENKTLFYPDSQLNNSSDESIELNESEDNSEQNQSFFEDSDFIFDICKEIENNNCSETRTTDDFKIENHKVNNVDFEKQVIQDINFYFSQSKIYENKIIELFYSCHENKLLYNLWLNNIFSHIVKILNGNQYILEKLFILLSNEEKEDLINEIIKHTSELIINENGYLSLQFLISLERINIINSINYFILSNFIYYSINDYSSEIICNILSISTFFIKNSIVEKINQHYGTILNYPNGIKIIKTAKKFLKYYFIY